MIGPVCAACLHFAQFCTKKFANRRSDRENSSRARARRQGNHNCNATERSRCRVAISHFAVLAAHSAISAAPAMLSIIRK